MKRKGVYSALMLLGMLSGCAVPGGGEKPASQANQALAQELAQVKASVSKAAAQGGEWRDTGKWIKQAETALSKGETDKAQKLLDRAREEAQLGLDQAQSQQDVVAQLDQLGKPVSAQVIEEGKKLSFDRKKGNCLSCHAMDDGVSPGTIGPPLVQIQQRFPNKGALYGQIWDATVRNPQTLMPPFGRHKILSKAELDKIVEYVWTL